MTAACLYLVASTTSDGSRTSKAHAPTAAQVAEAAGVEEGALVQAEAVVRAALQVGARGSLAVSRCPTPAICSTLGVSSPPRFARSMGFSLGQLCLTPAAVKLGPPASLPS